MEDLTRHQLILLVLLITFVTSIGTGIITVSLLQQAPVEMTQTINRVVERTIEKVTPAEGQSKEVITTVVSEDDSILDSIEKNEKSIVRLKTSGADGSEIVAGLGLVVANGIVMADSRSYNSASTYSIYFYDDQTFPAAKVFTEGNLVFIKLNTSQNKSYAFYPAAFGDSDALKIGQSIIAISGSSSNAASIGRIYQLVFGEDKKTVTNIFSDIKISRSHPGSPVLNLSGDVVGMEAAFVETDTEFSYAPSNALKTALAKGLEELSK